MYQSRGFFLGARIEKLVLLKEKKEEKKEIFESLLLLLQSL